MYLFSRLGAAEISTLWPFGYPLLVKNSFLPRTIRDWNDLPESLTFSAELSDDCLFKSTSFVKTRDLFSPVTAPGEGLPFWCFTSKIRFRNISSFYSLLALSLDNIVPVMMTYWFLFFSLLFYFISRILLHVIFFLSDIIWAYYLIFTALPLKVNPLKIRQIGTA